MLGLSRYVVCFVIDLLRPRITIAGIAPITAGEWRLQVARNLIDGCNCYLMNKESLLDDPDRWVTKFSIDL